MLLRTLNMLVVMTRARLARKDSSACDGWSLASSMVARYERLSSYVSASPGSGRGGSSTAVVDAAAAVEAVAAVEERLKLGLRVL
jgi:hypothetical protein